MNSQKSSVLPSMALTEGHVSVLPDEAIDSLALESEDIVVDGTLGGIAVHIGARVAALAGAGEVLVSSTVKDLVAGSGIQFRDCGSFSLKGLAGERHLYAVDERVA